MMQSQPNEPVSTERLLDLLSLFAAKLHQVTSQGVVLEVGDDLEMQSIKDRISDKQGEILRLRQQLARFRKIVARRKKLLSKSK